jgi:hypothetical protein
MGTQPTTQSSWQYTQQSTRGSRPASPIVTDCAAAIDQIINVVHQPAKLTFHRHRAPSTHLRPSGKESRQATRPNRVIEGGRPLGRHRKQLADMRQMGSLSDYLRRPSSPKAALGERRYRVAVPRSTHKRPGNPGTARGTGSRRTTQTPAGPETLAQHRGRDRATHAHAPPPRAANTDSAYYTFWQQILGDTEGTISNAYLTSRAITHAQRRTVLSIGMVSCGTSWHSGTNSATPTNAHCATKLTEAATSPQVAKTPS